MEEKKAPECWRFVFSSRYMKVPAVGLMYPNLTSSAKSFSSTKQYTHQPVCHEDHYHIKELQRSVRDDLIQQKITYRDVNLNLYNQVSL